ncbi:hypothetical protein [Micromonospora sp. NBC_01638]|uniref:hypothetical protein n=1 Tax=Micromonospora sp. NBC_01638 TaxID=2975982 RepID=UPI0038650532|nr:hypothetical protein OG811_18630 [Micromonospora sp. NBC_01638]
MGADGLVRLVASTADVAFSMDGAGAFATMTGAGATFSLGWPSPLPSGVIDRDMITYPNILPDVDLVVWAERWVLLPARGQDRGRGQEPGGPGDAVRRGRLR